MNYICFEEATKHIQICLNRVHTCSNTNIKGTCNVTNGRLENLRIPPKNIDGNFEMIAVGTFLSLYKQNPI